MGSVIDATSGGENESVDHRWCYRGLLLLVLCTLVFVGGLIAIRSVDPQLPQGVSRPDFEKAAADFKSEFGRSGDRFDILMTLADTAAKKKDSSTAIVCYTQIPTVHRRYGPSARFEEAQLLARTDRVQRAEDSFRTFLELQERGIGLPDRHVELSRRWLSLILGVELRSEERRFVLHDLMEDHQADIHDVKQYYFASLLIWQSAYGSGRVRDFLKLDPLNRHLRNANARYLIGEGLLEEARSQLLQLHREEPRDLQTLSFLLECDFEMNDWSSFAKDFSDVPQLEEGEPWLLSQLRGEWAIHQKKWVEAEQLFRHVVRIDPPNAAGHMGLAATFAGQGKVVERESILQRSQLIARLRVGLGAVTNKNATAAMSVASLARELGMEDATAIFEFFAAGMSTEQP